MQQLLLAPFAQQVFEAMEAAREAIEDAKPLLQQAVKLSDEVCGWHRLLCGAGQG